MTNKQIVCTSFTHSIFAVSKIQSKISISNSNPKNYETICFLDSHWLFCRTFLSTDYLGKLPAKGTGKLSVGKAVRAY